jgi:hypothetical protein
VSGDQATFTWNDQSGEVSVNTSWNCDTGGGVV